MLLRIYVCMCESRADGEMILVCLCETAQSERQRVAERLGLGISREKGKGAEEREERFLFSFFSRLFLLARHCHLTAMTGEGRARGALGCPANRLRTLGCPGKCLGPER